MLTVVSPWRKWAASGPERDTRRRVVRWAKAGVGGSGGFSVEKRRR